MNTRKDLTAVEFRSCISVKYKFMYTETLSGRLLAHVIERDEFEGIIAFCRTACGGLSFIATLMRGAWFVTDIKLEELEG